MQYNRDNQKKSAAFAFEKTQLLQCTCCGLVWYTQNSLIADRISISSYFYTLRIRYA